MATKQSGENEIRFPVSSDETIEALEKVFRQQKYQEDHGELDECFQKMGG